MPRTNGFENFIRRLDHWSDHGKDFGNCTVTQYEEMADAFLTEDIRYGVLECYRKCGDRIRYDPSSGAFGILSRDMIIKTFFKPIPCCWLPPGIYLPHICHGQP